MTEERRSKKTDLVLSNGQYAFTQDTTTGVVKVLTGPTVVNVTGQEYPVVYDVEAARFVAVDLEDAAQRSPMAAQGFYIELHNPPATDRIAQPAEGSKESAPSLLMGRRVNIPGPVTFSLWPRQVAKVIEGHHLRSNQYLLGRVYDEEAAKANWQKAVLKVAAGVTTEDAEPPDGRGGTFRDLTEDDLSVGKQFVIKGTEVSFYIPPTGVEVVPDEDGRFVREALTLERLQYCILIDETGDKDYQRGPKVVFPKPTQRFFQDPGTGSRMFRPTELNKKQGILVKVIATYEEDGRVYREGEELFITGADMPIYIPRPEHSLIRYDGRAKHFATAVVAGEARYVMNRVSGEIRSVHGPTMLLPDPREEVIVRRVLTDRECRLWYPGNEEARAYNEELRVLSARKPSTRSAVSEGEVRRHKKLGRGAQAGNVHPGAQSRGYADISTVHSEASGPVADEWLRAATFAEPRMLTLSSKFSGAPAIQVWPGYAVMVVQKSGERRVEVGPKSLLLGYDETLEVFQLSTDIPKSSLSREETVYLELSDNVIRDRLSLRTRDQVSIAIDLAFTVRFVGDDPSKWFAVDDYVGLAVHRVRRALSEAARALTVDAFFKDPSSVVTGAVMGAEGVPLFEENAMRIVDVELQIARIEDAAVRALFEEARAATIAAAVEREQLALTRERRREQAESERYEAELERESIERSFQVASARIASSILELQKKLEEQAAMDAIADSRQGAALARQQRSVDLSIAHQRAEAELSTAKLEASTKATVARFQAAQGPLAEAITMLGNQQVLAKVAEAVSAQRLFGGQNVSQVVGNLFEGTPLAKVFAQVGRRATPYLDEE